MSTQRTDFVNRQIYIINTAEAQTVCDALQNLPITAMQTDRLHQSSYLPSN